jgi:flagellar motor switch protein FliN
MNKPENVDIQSLILKIVPQLFNSMLAMKVTHSESDTESAGGADEPVVTLGFSGDVTGFVRMRPTADFARSMTTAKLGMETEEEPTAEEMQNTLSEFTTAAADQLKEIMAEAGISCDYSSSEASDATGAQNPQNDPENLEQLFFLHGENKILRVEMALNIHEYVEDTEIADKYAQDTSIDAPQEQQRLRPVKDFDLDLIFDIPIELTVEIGRTKISINELLELGPGSAVSLTKLESEPVDILANDTLIARGQVVVQDEKYGIRVTEITSRMDRIKSLT